MERELTFQGSGTLRRIDSIPTKRGDIKILILDTEGSHPQVIPIRVFGDVAQEVDNLPQGTVLKVWGTLGGREWNGKVYADVAAEKIEVVIKGVQKAPPPSGTRSAPADDDELF